MPHGADSFEMGLRLKVHALRMAGAAAFACVGVWLLAGCASGSQRHAAQHVPESGRLAAPVSAPSTGAPAKEPRDQSALAMPGSHAAKDDLYCWAILGEHFDAQRDFRPGEADRLLDAQKRLEASGVAALTREGVTGMDNWASLTVAYAEKARADYRRNTLRLSVDACLERASRLPARRR